MISGNHVPQHQRHIENTKALKFPKHYIFNLTRHIYAIKQDGKGIIRTKNIDSFDNQIKSNMVNRFN